MYPTLPPGSHPSPISSIIQHLHGASAGRGGGRAQPEPFTLSAWSQTNPGREPPVALVLADWSSRLAQVDANLSGSTPHQQRNQMLTSLWHMSQDTRLPIDVRTRVSNEATSMRAQSGREVQDFQKFRSWVQDESAARTGHLQTPQDTGHQVSLPASNAPTATTMQRGRPDQSLADSVRIPSNARALANWASEFEKVFTSMEGLTDAERQQRIGARLWSMVEDRSVPEEFRLAAVDELSNVHAPDGVMRFSSFEQAVRRESLARAGNAREAINELLEKATTSIHQQLSRSDPLPHDMNGTSAASDAVFGSSVAQGRNPSATREPAATADIALPMAIPMPIDQLNGNQNPPVQLVNNSNPAFSKPPAQRASVDSGIPPRINEVMDRMLANPMLSHNRIAQNLCGERNSSNLRYAKFSVLQARNHLAFGASQQTRSTVQHHLNLSRNLQDPTALKAVGRALAQLNANHNPIVLKTLAAAAEKYVGEGGQQATLTLPDLAGYVDEGRGTRTLL